MTAPVDGGALTQNERAGFEYLRACFADHDGIALVRSALDGRPCAVVAVVEQQADDQFAVTPLAVLVDDDLMNRLTDPTTLGEQKPTRTLWPVFSLGERDPWPWSDYEPCGEREPDVGYRCSAPTEHGHPQHVAVAQPEPDEVGTVVAVWT